MTFLPSRTIPQMLASFAFMLASGFFGTLGILFIWGVRL